MFNVKIAITALFVVVMVGLVGYNYQLEQQAKERKQQAEQVSPKTPNLPTKTANNPTPNSPNSTIAPAPISQKTADTPPSDADVQVVAVDTDEMQRLHQITQLKQLYSRWKDGEALALATSKIALATPVKNLQDIRREVLSLTVDNCLTPAKNALAGGMEHVLQGYYDFMTNEGEVAGALAYLAQDKAKPLFAEFENGINRCH